MRKGCCGEQFSPVEIRVDAAKTIEAEAVIPTALEADIWGTLQHRIHKRSSTSGEPLALMPYSVVNR